MSDKQHKICVLGAGSWGTALAIQLARNGNHTVLWGHRADEIEEMKQTRENVRYLPDISLPDSLQLDSDLACIKDAEDLLIVVPSHAFRETLKSIMPHLKNGTRISWATKGLEQDSQKLLHQVAKEELGNRPVAIISGPTFAKEVAQGLPTAVTVASNDEFFAMDMATRLHGHNFRAYTSDDIIGVEIGGAVKNVLAIAAGIADGLGYGANTRSAIITRGLIEVMRLGVAMGGKQETFMGLAGLGDLVLTCTDNQSRNRRYGIALGQGKDSAQALIEIDQVVEGIRTANEIHKLAQKQGVDMPLALQVYRVLHQGLPAKEAVMELLGRDLKSELE
ncbi:MAG: NAD(P)H-dependent glycerol-3-phosphate dehydrogenase [Gammaproteobacteria bacterium]|nr:NAD(P)H-dependent glycerol-3-phosphate dehydrogenase [Gammaproteobacteria bacterium]